MSNDSRFAHLAAEGDPYGLRRAVEENEFAPLAQAFSGAGVDPGIVAAEERLLQQFKAQPPAQGAWPELRLYWEKLAQNLAALKIDGGIALAFSGGLDSLVLLQLCREIDLEVLALHFRGPQFAASHSEEAIRWLEEHDAPYKIIEYNSLGVPEVRRSDVRRCYFCKKHIFGLLKEAAGGRILCDGTNSTDFMGYRPGLDALREHGVYSPFASVMLTKPQIRQIAQMLGLELPRLRGQNCLLTRFEYGLPVAEEKLRVIEQVEAEVAPLLSLYDASGRITNALPYRLRFVSDFSAPGGVQAELHIESAMRLPASLQVKLAELLERHGLGGAPVRVMAQVSGYFDKDLHGID